MREFFKKGFTVDKDLISVVGVVLSAVLLVYLLLRLPAWEWLALLMALSPAVIGWLIYNQRRELEEQRAHVHELESRVDGMGRSLADLRQSAQDLARRNEYLAALHETALDVVGWLDLDELLEAIVTRAAQLVGSSHGYLLLSESFAAGRFQPGDMAVVCPVGFGLFEKFRGYHTDAPPGLSARVWQTGRAFKLDDYDVWLGRSPDIEPGIMGAAMGVPLHLGDHIVGAIGLSLPADAERIFDDGELELLGRFAGLASIALENAHLYRAAHRSREAAEAANLAKSAFLANMSHELRTPLNAILGFSNLMLEDENLTAEQCERLQTIGHSGEHLLTLINDVLELSKIEEGRTELQESDFDLWLMLLGLEEMFSLRAEARLDLLFERAPNVPQYVKADEHKLRQVLVTLLGYAIKSAESGSVSLRAKFSPAGSESGQAVDRLWFEVEDTGSGIAPEELESVFDPFVQTGSGHLGLPISRRFVQMMGGNLTLDSEVGKGSRFQFDIRVQIVRPAGVPAAQSRRRVIGLEPGQPNYRLLIVEDVEASRQLLLDLLQPVGFDVRAAADGQQGIEIWREWEPDLIWMDVRMPVVDGVAATQQIRTASVGRKPVIIALTASSFEEEREQILGAGFDDFVRKPFRGAEILQVLARHLDVRYRYEDVSRPARAGELTLSDLQALPPKWLADFQDAVDAVDLESARALVDQISADHGALSESLAILVGNYRFDMLQSLLEGMGP